MIDQNGVEAFVKAGDIGGVVSALSMTIGALVADGSSDPSLRM